MSQCGPVSQGDANRSYSDEDQSSSNMEELDKFQEGLDSSGGKKASTCHLGAKTWGSSLEAQVGTGQNTWLLLQPRLALPDSLWLVIHIHNGNKCYILKRQGIYGHPGFQPQE